MVQNEPNEFLSTGLNVVAGIIVHNLFILHSTVWRTINLKYQSFSYRIFSYSFN